MRRRRSCRVGRVRPRAAACRRPGEIVHATEVWAEPAGGGAVVARAAGAARRALRLLHGARRRRARPSARATAGRARRRPCTSQWLRSRDARAPGRTSTPTASGRSPSLGASCSRAARCRSTATTLVFFVAGDAGALCAPREPRASSRRRTRELPTLREAGVRLDLLVGSGNDPGERYDGALDVGARRADRRAATAASRTASRSRRAAAGPDRRHLRRGRLVRRRARASRSARGDACTKRSRSRRGGRRGDHGAGPVRRAASVAADERAASPGSRRTPVKALALAPLDEVELSEAGPRATGASTSSARPAGWSTTRTSRRSSWCAPPTTTRGRRSTLTMTDGRTSAARSSAGRSSMTSFHSDASCPPCARPVERGALGARRRGRFGSSSRAAAPDRGRSGAATLLATASLGALVRARRRPGRRPALPDELRDRGARAARGGHLDRAPRAGRRCGRDPATATSAGAWSRRRTRTRRSPISTR